MLVRLSSNNFIKAAGRTVRLDYCLPLKMTVGEKSTRPCHSINRREIGFTNVRQRTVKGVLQRRFAARDPMPRNLILIEKTIDI
jgi:hypothetical protein